MRFYRDRIPLTWGAVGEAVAMSIGGTVIAFLVLAVIVLLVMN